MRSYNSIAEKELMQFVGIAKNFVRYTLSSSTYCGEAPGTTYSMRSTQLCAGGIAFLHSKDP
jgi:hypothetical protein